MKSYKNKENQLVKGSKQLFSSAVSVASGTLLSRFLGFLRDIILASQFDKTVTDAFVAAFRLPNLFRRIFGEGSLSSSFIPMYVDAEKRDRDKNSVRGELKGAMFSFLLIVSSVLSVLGFIFMEDLLPLLLSGEQYQKVAGKMVFTIWLARIMFFYLFLVTNYAFLMAVAQVHKHFFIPALAPALFNLVFIIFMFFPATWFSEIGLNLAYGVIIGGVFQFLLVFALLVKIKQLPKPNLNFGTWGFGKTLRNMVPGMIGMGIVQIMSVINLYYLSRLEEGSISYIYYADRILELPQSLIAISLGVALLPTLSKLWSQQEPLKMIQTLSDNFNLLLFLILPSAVGMFILADPIVKVIFMNGKFNLIDAQQTADVVRIYSVLLIAASSTKIIINGFYAIKNTWIPAVTTIVSIGVHLVMAPILMEVYGLEGLVYSMTLAAIINLILCLVFFFFVIGSLNYSQILILGFKHFCSALVMGIVVYWFFGWTRPLQTQPIGLALLLAASVILGIFTYFFLCSRWKSAQANYILSIGLKKLQKRS